MNRVLYPERILDRNVGGNTTYTRALAEGVTARGWGVGRVPAAQHPALTVVSETRFARARIPDGTVLHFSADTGPLVKTRAPSVLTVHGIASRWISVARNPRQEAIWRTRVRRAIAACDHVITVSQSSADDISEVFEINREDMSVIHHGIDSERFAKPTEISEAVRRKLPSEYALYVGNIEPRKNVASLARAFEGLDIPLVIAGRFAWNFEDAARAIDESDNVISLGFVSDDDRIGLMQRCSLFVFPSHYEGFGFPVLEAQAAGAPTLCSDAGSLAEVAGPARRLADLSVEGIRHGVVEALADQAWLDNVTDQGVTWARRFSWASSIDAHLRVYEQALGEAR